MFPWFVINCPIIYNCDPFQSSSKILHNTISKQMDRLKTGCKHFLLLVNIWPSKSCPHPNCPQRVPDTDQEGLHNTVTKTDEKEMNGSKIWDVYKLPLPPPLLWPNLPIILPRGGGGSFTKIVRGCAYRTSKIWLSLYQFFAKFPTHQYTIFERQSTQFGSNWVLFTIICPKYTQFM